MKYVGLYTVIEDGGVCKRQPQTPSEDIFIFSLLFILLVLHGHKLTPSHALYLILAVLLEMNLLFFIVQTHQEESAQLRGNIDAEQLMTHGKLL